MNIGSRTSPQHRQQSAYWDNLMMNARENEKKLMRFRCLELELISQHSLIGLIETLLYPKDPAFKWDALSLLLLDEEYECQRILEDKHIDLKKHPNLMFTAQTTAISGLFQQMLVPALGPYRERNHSHLFNNSEQPIKSVAFIPLIRRGRLIGSFNIGSYNGERFSREVRADFLAHLGGIIAISFENTTNIERLTLQGLTDTLTSINNRRFFDQRIKEEMSLVVRDQKPLSCLLLDIDFFKRVNDDYGHQSGDLVLMEVAALIRAQMRGSDVLSRYGGEEFSALLIGASQEEGVEVAERIRESIDEHVFVLPSGEKIHVTISIGHAIYYPHEERLNMTGDSLVAQSDKALYQAKHEGRNRVCCAEVLV